MKVEVEKVTIERRTGYDGDPDRYFAWIYHPDKRQDTHWMSNDTHEWYSSGGDRAYWTDYDGLIRAIRRTTKFANMKTPNGMVKQVSSNANTMARRMFAAPNQVKTSFRKKK